MVVKRVLLLLCVLYEVAYSYKCTFDASNGDHYDFSPLTKCDHTGYTLGSSNHDAQFVINICLEASGCDNGAGVCQENTWDAGRASDISFSAGSNGEVVLKYGGGQTDPSCPSGGARTSTINLICDQSATTPTFTFVSESPKCTYNFNVKSKYACPTTKGPQIQTCPLNVFLVPHTHDDVGWLQTIDGYYQSTVRSIISTSVQSLMANPDRHFVYVEQAFFHKWWTDSSVPAQLKTDLKSLVAAGRWEFIIGGWTMQDEACTTYVSNVNQMTQGHQFLLDTFGVRPNRGWQLDPFGASPVTPYLQKLAGFESHLIDRISDKDSYQNNQRLQFNWESEPSVGAKSELFTEIYGGASNAYCDWWFSFPFDKSSVQPSDVASWGQKFLQMAGQRRAWYKTNNLLAMWGCDFQFMNAGPIFASMDLVVAWLKSQEANTNVHVRYTNVSAYFDAVKASAVKDNIQWQVNNGGDFFPYLGFGKYWTGYFTSRTQLKGIVRYGESVSQAVEPWHAVARAIHKDSNASSNFNALNTLRMANADATHHDGVSGTSNPDVVLMFGNDVNNGVNSVKSATTKVLANFASGSSTPALSADTKSILNIQSGQTVAVVLTNPLGWSRTSIVPLDTNFASFKVVDASGQTVPSQVAINRVSVNPTSKYVLYFRASVPALGFNTYFVTAGSSMASSIAADTVGAVEDQNVKNSVYQLTISNNIISSITNLGSQVTASVSQQIKSYTSASSGAYAFKPSGASSAFSTPAIRVNEGSLVTEITQNFSSYAKQVIRLYHADGNADVEGFVETWTELGPLPSHRELISSWSSTLDTNNKYYTDANGLQFLERTIDTNIGIEGNYYPMVYASYIKDSNAQISLIGERAHGAGSTGKGELEVMIHRNPDMGDGFGPGLTDTTVVYPVLRTVVDAPAKSLAQVYRQIHLLNFPLIPFTAQATNAKDYAGKYATTNQLLKGDLPANVHLLSLNALDASSTKAILRFTHLFATGEDAKWSAPVTVDVSKLFQGVKIASFVETTLTANKVLDSAPSQQVTLNPKDIRTFIIEFA